MSDFLYKIVGWVAKIHNYIMKWNDDYEYNFTDKELHFLIIGMLGMVLIFAIYPLFKWLAKHHHVMVIAWIHIFTLILVLAFAIEIGQKVTSTGVMDFDDIVFGVVGFIVMFVIFSIIRAIWHLIVRGIKQMKEKKTVENGSVMETLMDEEEKL